MKRHSNKSALPPRTARQPLPPIRQSRAVSLPVRAVFAQLLAIAAFLLIASLLQTSVIDPNAYRKEHILYWSDHALVNIAILLVLLAGAVFALFRLRGRTDRIPMRAVKIALAVWVFGMSCLWAFSIRSIPEADSARVVEAARLAAAGDFSFFGAKLQYFQMFPYQLGIVAFYEPFFRLFGGGAYAALWLTNAAALAAGELALVTLAEALFPDRRAALATAVLLALCPQPVLFCSFLYGNLPGLAAMLWAFVLVVRLLNGARARSVVWIALLCALGVALKSNSWIGVAAIVLTLLISLPERFRPAKLVCCAAVVAAPLLLTRAVQAGYEQRADIRLGGGTPQTAWLVMGFSESERAPGWYNGYSYSVLKDAGWDTDRARQIIAGDLAERLDALTATPGALGSFLLKKTLSQWNEPSFESIWISKVKQHEAALPVFAESVYNGAAGEALGVWFEHETSLLYAAFAAGMLALLLRKHPDTPQESGAFAAPSRAALLLPALCLLGGFVYHLLFEAKSQYTLSYLVMMVPYAAFGLTSLADFAARLRRQSGNEARLPPAL